MTECPKCNRCDAIANRIMAEKQKGWDMERVALLEKIKNTRATDPLMEEMARALEWALVKLEEASQCGYTCNDAIETVSESLQKYRER